MIDFDPNKHKMGKPCKHGHALRLEGAPAHPGRRYSNTRYLNGSTCIACSNPQVARELEEIRQEASMMALPDRVPEAPQTTKKRGRPKKLEDGTVLTLRISGDLLKRLDEKVQEIDKQFPGFAITRTDVARQALEQMLG